MSIKATQQYQTLRNFLWSSAMLFYKILLIFMSISFFQACKEPNGIGLEVQPESEKFNVNTGSGNNFISFSLKESAPRSDETSLNLLGSYNDPIFGKSQAGFLAQFILSQNTPSFGSSPIVDSIVLCLPYSGYYGNYSGQANKQRFQVFQVNKKLYRDSIYYSNLATNNYILSTPLADTIIEANPITPIIINGSTYAAQLRIKLNKSFGEALISSATAPYLNSSGEFLNYLQGLYVTTNNAGQSVGNGAIYNFNLLNAESKLILYFKNTEGTGNFSLIVSSDCARINVFNTDYSTATDISNQLNDASKGQAQIYLQSMGGLKAKIDLPVLKFLKDSMPIAINQAEITFKVKEGTYADFAPPARLFLIRIDSVGTTHFLSDQAEGDAYYGGLYNSSTNEYTFNVARYFQQVLSGKYQDYGLYLLVGASAVTANRVVLNGGDQIKLKLTYTKL